MAKINLKTVLSGFNLNTINENFQSLADELQNNVLYRNNPFGEPNQLETQIDANSQRFINLVDATNNQEPVTLSQLNAVASPIVGTTTAALVTHNGSNVGAITDNYDQPTTSVMRNALDYKVGDVVRTQARSTGKGGAATYDVVLTSSVTVNPFNILIGIADPLISFVLREKTVLEALQWGDTTAAWQAAIAKGKSVDFGNGTYVITDPLALTNNKQDIFGQRAKFSFSASYNTVGGTVLKMFEPQAVEDVHIYGIDFDMTPNAGAVGGGGSFGIRYLTGSKRGSVHHCTFKNQELTSLASVTSASGSSDIDVHHNIFYTNSLLYGGGGILHSGARALANNNMLFNLGDTYISLDDTLGGTCNSNLFSNTLLDGSVLRAAGTVIQVAQGSVGCVVDGNTFNGIAVVGIFVFDSIGNTQDHHVISNNVMNGGGVSDPATPSVFILADTDSSNIDIHGNTIWNASGTAAGSFGIQVRNRNVTVHDNIVRVPNMTRAIQVSFEATDDEYIRVYNNETEALGQCIQFSSGDYNNTMQLHCYDNNIENAAEGLKVDASNFIAKIHGNTFKGNTAKTAGTWQYNVYFNTSNSDERPGSEILKRVYLYGAAIPVAGSWLSGDKIVPTNRAVDGNNMILDHFECVSSGTPGTWVSKFISTVSPAT